MQDQMREHAMTCEKKSPEPPETGAAPGRSAAASARPSAAPRPDSFVAAALAIFSQRRSRGSWRCQRFAPLDPADPKTPVTVTADSLPTAQHDGVAWQAAVIGNTVYVAGQFSNARPFGAAPGTQLTARRNILAFDITTGRLITGFAPVLNAQALAVAASPDGSRLYIGGDFTSVNGVQRWRVAALDPVSGSLIGSFAPRMNAASGPSRPRPAPCGWAAPSQASGPLPARASRPSAPRTVRCWRGRRSPQAPKSTPWPFLPTERGSWPAGRSPR